MSRRTVFQTPRCLFAIPPKNATPRKRLFSPPQARNLTHCSPLHASDGTVQSKIRSPAQKSVRVQQREMSNPDTIPDDIGIFDGTLIMPTGTNLPSLFRPRTTLPRLKLEWHRFKLRTTDFLGLIYFKFMITEQPNPRPKLAIFHTGGVAKALHSRMYTAFAEGDVETLEKTCAMGLLSSFKGRIASRQPGERLKWTLHRYKGRAKVVSNRAMMLPIGKGTALRQAVVRIRSRQSLERLRADGTIVSSGEQTDKEKKSGGWMNGLMGKGQGKDVTEYVVIQRFMKRQKEEPWMVWGTLEEANWEKVLEDMEAI